jgi:hypothetical protein
MALFDSFVILDTTFCWGPSPVCLVWKVLQNYSSVVEAFLASSHAHHSGYMYKRDEKSRNHLKVVLLKSNYCPHERNLEYGPCGPSHCHGGGNTLEWFEIGYGRLSVSDERRRKRGGGKPLSKYIDRDPETDDDDERPGVVMCYWWSTLKLYKFTNGLKIPFQYESRE